MHTSLQAKLFEEIYNLVNDKSQLWISTHSFGILKKAREIENDHNATISFIDFSNRDFDSVVEIEPSEIDSVLWSNIIDLTIGNLSSIKFPEFVVLCEGESNGKINKDFDEKVYSKIFCNEFGSKVVFYSIGNCDNVCDENNKIFNLIKKIFDKSKIIRVIDRDDKSDIEVKELTERGITVLSKRNIESYLLDDEVLIKLCNKKNHPEMAEIILKEKENLINSSQNQGYPIDDLKRIRGELYNIFKKKLQLTQCGSNAETFMRDTIAPIITKDMSVYRTLKKDIFGEN